MFHGRKKVERKKLTEKEVEAIEAKLVKIAKNNRTLLEKRANKEYTLETLAQTEKFSFLSPDFTTLWNYRREILVWLFEINEETRDDAAKKL